MINEQNEIPEKEPEQISVGVVYGDVNIVECEGCGFSFDPDTAVQGKGHEEQSGVGQRCII